MPEIKKNNFIYLGGISNTTVVVFYQKKALVLHGIKIKHHYGASFSGYPIQMLI